MLLENSEILQLDALEKAPVIRDPFDFVYVPGFIARQNLAHICADFPKLRGTGSYPLDGLSYGPAFRRLIAELTGKPMQDLVGDKFGLDLTAKPTMITLRGRVGARDGFIHTDSETKIMTLLLYLNEEWSASAGRLRLLRGPDDLEDSALEIEPALGNLLIFRRSERSYHGHYPANGPRQALQMNWLIDSATRDRELRRHRRSAWLKHLGFKRN